jgi:uncharacterized integral membrane protein (TIGR02327 family)
MNIKIYLYVIFVFLSAYVLSSINFDAFMKKNKPLEARILVVVLSCIMGYLLTNFVTDFISLTTIIG